MLQRLYSINIYSLQKHGFWEPFQIMEKKQRKKKKKKKKKIDIKQTKIKI